MPEHAIRPPIHLVTHPDEPIRSLEAAAKVIRRHAGDQLDRRAERVLQRRRWKAFRGVAGFLRFRVRPARARRCTRCESLKPDVIVRAGTETQTISILFVN
jgi:hypothetical protein